MSEDAVTTPRPKLRPSGGVGDQRPAARPPVEEPDRSGGRSLPVRVVLLVGLLVLQLLAGWRPGGVAAVVGIPLALLLPGAVLQPRFLPGLHTDPVTRWFLRIALSLATWALVGLAVGAAGIPVRSVWPVVVGVVLLAAVVVGETEGERRFGRVGAARAGWGVLAVVVAAVVVVGTRGLVAVTGSGAGSAADVSVTAGFADPTVPFALAATGARASTTVVVTNTGDEVARLEIGGRVGRALPWPVVEVTLAAGSTRIVDIAGPVPVCSDPQQIVVTVEGAGELAPLSAVVPGAADGIRCGAG